MTRFKKELRKRGVKLECDYPHMPFDLGTHTLEGVVVDSEKCTVTYYTTAIKLVDFYDRQTVLFDQFCD